MSTNAALVIIFAIAGLLAAFIVWWDRRKP
jgi:hypothetical protein